LLVVFSSGSAETNVRWGGKLNICSMASCIRNVTTKNYQNLGIGFQVTVKCRGCFCLRRSVVIVYL